MRSQSPVWVPVWLLMGATLVPQAPADAAAVPGWKQHTVTFTAARGLTDAMIARVAAVAKKDNTRFAVVHQGTIEGISVRSGTRIIQSFSSGRFVPLSLKAISTIDAREFLGDSVASRLGDGDVVLSATSAKLRRAKVSDVITVTGWNGRSRPLRITRVVEDRLALDGELLVSLETAQSLGVERPQAVVLWRFPKRRDGFVTKLRTTAGSFGRVVDSWSPATVDTTLSQAQTKTIAGEFNLARAKGNVVIDGNWKQTHLATVAIPSLGNLTCNKAMTAAVQQSFKQIAEAGLDTKIDFVDTKRFGGCFNAREIRTISGTSGRNLSRHSWAIALDINPTTNAYGAVPTLDRCVVEIFRSNGFAWGGTFLVPDGMHFEFTGQAAKTAGRLPPCAKPVRP